MALLTLALAATPESLLTEARRAERAGDAATELRLCAQLLEEAPAGHAARAPCEGRLRWLSNRQDADGGFASLSAFEALRGQGGAPLLALRARPGLPLALRNDISLALVRAGGDPALLGDWTSIEPAQDAARRAILGPEAAPRLGPALSAAAIGAWALGCLPLSFPGAWPRPLGLGILAVVGALTALIAGLWEAVAGWAVLAMLPPLALVHLGALRALASGRRLALSRLLSAGASLGVVYLVLWRFELLDRVGL